MYMYLILLVYDHGIAIMYGVNIKIPILLV